jgi:hypothetical protein
MLCGVDVNVSSLKFVGCTPTDILLTVAEGSQVILLHHATEEGREWGRYESATTLCPPPILDIEGAFDKLLRLLRIRGRETQ